MAKEPDKPAARTILTGTAQPVTDSVERARGFLKDRPEPFRPESTKPKNFRRTKKPEVDQRDEPPGEPDTPEPEKGGGGEGDDAENDD